MVGSNFHIEMQCILIAYHTGIKNNNKKILKKKIQTDHKSWHFIFKDIRYFPYRYIEWGRQDDLLVKFVKLHIY